MYSAAIQDFLAENITREELAAWLEESVLPDDLEKRFREAASREQLMELGREFGRFLKARPMPERGVRIAADGTVEISGEEFADWDDFKKLRRIARTFVTVYFRGQKYAATGEDGQKTWIEITRRGIGENFSKASTLDKIRSMIALPELIETARHESFEPVRPAKPKERGQIIGYHRYISRLRIKERLYKVRLLVREHREKDEAGNTVRRLYLHDLESVGPSKIDPFGDSSKTEVKEDSDPKSPATLNESIANKNSPVKEKEEGLEESVVIEEKITKAQEKRLDSIVAAADKASTLDDLLKAGGRFARLWLNVGSKGKTRIEDFGEKIGGARKDMWRQNAMSLDDLHDLNELEKLEHVKKDNIWARPDYKKMAEDGVDPAVGWLIKKIRDATPAKLPVPARNPCQARTDS